MRGVSRGEPRPRIVQHFNAHGDVADADAEIDQRLAFPRGVPPVYVVRAYLELQRSRHAIVRLKLIVAGFLPVLVEIDEPWRDDKPLRVDGRLPSQRLLRYGNNLASRECPRCARRPGPIPGPSPGHSR